ncbi:MAG: hypothetical protein J6I56_08805, partial [Lachnospiraceae bacterium]|nr:hypothetical protein [Lachnospiraceae bacterium]
TQAIQAGQISPKIRGTGTLEANDPYSVMVQETRKISSVAVKVGDTVHKDTVIYYLEDKKSAELEEAQKTLDTMETAYEKSLFSGTLTDATISRLRAGQTDTMDGYQARLRALQDQYKAAKNADRDVDLAKQILSSNQAWTDAERAYDSLTPGYTVADAELELANPNIDEDRKEQLQYFIASKNREKSQLDNETAQVDQHFASQQASLDYQKALTSSVYTRASEEREEKLAELQLEIDLVSQQEEMAKQRDKIRELQEKAVGAVVSSPVEGIVTSLAYTAGESTQPDAAAAVIQVAGKPMTASFSVTSEQAKKLKVGDIAEPQNVWYYTDFKATLKAIQPDKADPAGHKQLTFLIESPEVTAGQSVSLQLGEAPRQYEMTVPNSAVREDNNGKFILILKSKSSPIGNRYRAQRVDVQVVASDDKLTAITGAVDSWEYVITTSTAPIKAGDMVRLSNENA